MEFGTDSSMLTVEEQEAALRVWNEVDRIEIDDDAVQASATLEDVLEVAAEGGDPAVALGFDQD